MLGHQELELFEIRRNIKGGLVGEHVSQRRGWGLSFQNAHAQPILFASLPNDQKAALSYFPNILPSMPAAMLPAMIKLD